MNTEDAVNLHELPLFVYGTLLAGERNAHVINDDAVVQRLPARMHGLAIYGRLAPYPFAVPETDATTLGELVWLSKSWKGIRTREAVDALEGYQSGVTATFYDRITATATTEAGEHVRCLTYIAAPQVAARIDPSDRIIGGDWRVRGAE